MSSGVCCAAKTISPRSAYSRSSAMQLSPKAAPCCLPRRVVAHHGLGPQQLLAGGGHGRVEARRDRDVQPVARRALLPRRRGAGARAARPRSRGRRTRSSRRRPADRLPLQVTSPRDPRWSPNIVRSSHSQPRTPGAQIAGQRLSRPSSRRNVCSGLRVETTARASKRRPSVGLHAHGRAVSQHDARRFALIEHRARRCAASER